MRTIPITELRVNLTSTMRSIHKGNSVVVTQNGKPVAKLVPFHDWRKEAQAAIKKLGKTAFIGDIVSPTEEQWNIE